MSWLDGDRRAARNRRAQGPFRRSAKSPEERTRAFKTPRWSAERRCRVPLSFGDPGDKPRLVDYAPFGAPPPLILGRISAWSQFKDFCEESQPLKREKIGRPRELRPSSPRMRGSSIPESPSSAIHLASTLEYWVARSSRAMTGDRAAATSLLHRAVRHRRPQIALREWEFSGPSLSIEKRGGRNAARRTLVTAAACFPDRRETEAHGNASRRSTAAS